MALSNPVNPDWARALLEAVPTCGRKAIQDLVLMEHLGRPKAGDESNWQWTLKETRMSTTPPGGEGSILEPGKAPFLPSQPTGSSSRFPGIAS